MTAKRLSALALTLIMALVTAFGALAAETEATALPFGVDFSMDYDTALKTVGEGAEQDDWGDETGTLLLGERDLGLIDITAANASLQIDRNNSDEASRLSQISANLPIGDNCIADFRAALAALTAVYGAPDEDPFNEIGVEIYVEYGNLSATWTKTDVRINLYMSRMYDASLSLDFTNRLCYNADDLK